MAAKAVDNLLIKQGKLQLSKPVPTGKLRQGVVASSSPRKKKKKKASPPQPPRSSRKKASQSSDFTVYIVILGVKKFFLSRLS